MLSKPFTISRLAVVDDLAGYQLIAQLPRFDYNRHRLIVVRMMLEHCSASESETSNGEHCQKQADAKKLKGFKDDEFEHGNRFLADDLVEGRNDCEFLSLII